jgi:hypothetical protein
MEGGTRGAAAGFHKRSSLGAALGKVPRVLSSHLLAGEFALERPEGSG